MNLPNKLTLIRICLVPLFIACFYIDAPWALYVAAVIFVAAFITDIADGHLARSRNLVTNFGKLMDPIADKLLTASALIMLTAKGMLGPIAAIIIIAREFLISGFRLVSAGSGVVIAANWLGKIKTITQAVAMVLVMLQDLVLRIFGFRLDVWMVWISVFFTVISAWDYIVKNRKCIDFK
ncbi:MAG: CDP-diacylglycerol--glycerol-3-phosphate 3-phosphatidyltransferase [Clostridia bacterium]|nr:CDP-diacylglycerol--glycerol-3-phosphate 3-phosphatidyltransferase [Clostridia bacterium]